MKVFIINVVCGSGSTGHIVVDLYKALIDSENEAYIAYGRGDASKSVHSYRIGNDANVLVHAGLSRLAGRQGEHSKRATRKLIKEIKTYRPDIIHLHNIHGYYINYTILFDFLREYHQPVVWTMHDCWAFTGHCAHYEGVACDGWERGCQRCHYPFTYPKAYMECSTSRRMEKKKKAFLIPNLSIITPSTWLQKQLQKSFFQNVSCTVINNGIDLQIFQPMQSNMKDKLGITGKKLILGVASVWTDFKGFSDLLELSQKLNQSYVICMVGLNQRQIKHLPAHVIGIEKTQNQKELAMFYSAADVFVNLTYEDTFPTTNIEALACGTPVITYRTGGSTEIIDESCGAAVERGNMGMLIRKIEEWTEEDHTAACREHALIFYGKDESIHKYLQYYGRMQEKMR